MAGFDVGGDTGLALVVAAYLDALVDSPASDAAAPATPKIDAPAKAAAVALESVRDVRSADPRRRAAALVALARVRRPLPAWFEPSARLATAVALASDSDAGVHDRGMALLASLQAADAVSQPLLAARAAAQAKRLAVREPSAPTSTLAKSAPGAPAHACAAAPSSGTPPAARTTRSPSGRARTPRGKLRRAASAGPVKLPPPIGARSPLPRTVEISLVPRSRRRTRAFQASAMKRASPVVETARP
jgi:hypothetical protein